MKQTLCVAAFLAALPFPGVAQTDSRTAAREIVRKWQDAIVTVRVTLKLRMSMGGREMNSSDDSVDTVGTVIEPTGLTVVSLGALNPGATMNKIMGAAVSGQDRPSLSSEPTDVKIRIADGRELAAKIVLRDEDLDLAFLLPTGKLDKPLTAISLADASRPALLDEVVVLSRLGRVGGWTPSAVLQNITAIIDKPRTFFVAEAGASASMGTPAFLPNGKVVGLLTLRSVDPGRPGMMAMMGTTEGLGLLASHPAGRRRARGRQAGDGEVAAMDAIAHYNLIERIGKGGLGETYRARDTRVGRTVALKLVDADVAPDAESRARLLGEATIAATLSHPNVSTLFDTGEADGQVYLAYEYAPGHPMLEEVAGGAMNPRRALELAVQLADGVADAHAHGIIHGDLRPGTVIITPKGSAKILDFGFARWTRGGMLRAQASHDPDGLPADATRVLAYLSPEQALGGTIDSRTDVFSLGVMIYEVLTGRNPFAAPTAAATGRQRDPRSGARRRRRSTATYRPSSIGS